MTPTLEAIVKQLEDSGIVAAGRIRECIPPTSPPKDAKELLQQLVKQNQLTRYQAQQIAKGQAKSLILGSYTIVDRIGAGGMG